MSDPLWDIDSWSWFSYVASTLEIVGALAVGFAGYAVVRAQGLASFATTTRRRPRHRDGLPPEAIASSAASLR